MRKLFAFISVFITINAVGQPNWYIGGDIALQKTKLLSVDDFGLNPSISYKSTIKPAFNFKAGVLFKERISLTSGVSISSQGQNYYITPPPGSLNCYKSSDRVELNTNLTYFKVPVRIGYRLLNKSSYKIELNAGTTYCQLIGADDNYEELLSCLIGIAPLKTRVVKQDIELNGGVSALIKRDDRTTFVLGVQIGYGLKKVFNDGRGQQQFIYVDAVNSFNRIYGLYTGIVYNLKG